MKNFFWVKDVPFNAIMVENLQRLVYIAEKLERGYDAEYFSRKRDAMIKAMRALMFEDGFYWSTFGENYQKIKVKTWAIFAPLFAKLLSRDEAEILVKNHLTNPKEFWCPYPISTVSVNEPSFNPKDMWRGPVWLAVNWFVYQGLKNYGYNEEAAALKEKSLALIAKNGFREYFNPLTGEGLGARDFTWGGLLLDMN